MILVWGTPKDPPVAAVLSALTRTGREAFLLDQDDKGDFAFEPGVCGRSGSILSTGVGTIDLAEVTAAYIRPFATAGSPVERELSAELLGWCDVASACIVNRPEAMASNNSKPYQAALIHASGFAVPKTIVTNDSGALAAFAERHGPLIYKSASGVRSIVARYDPRDGSRLGDLATCPTQFQQWIAGTDVRVHVVGDEVFACEVRSTAIDYRYPDNEAERPRLTACTLPVGIAQRCRELAAALGLAFAGIDLRRTDQGEWVCFEVNPSPAFTYYEDATGLPIAAALAELLAG